MRVLLNATDGPLSVRAVRRYVTEMVTGLGSPTSGIDLHVAFFTHRRKMVRHFLSSLPEDVTVTPHLFRLPRRVLNERHRRSRWELRRLARQVDLYHETTIDSPDFDELPVVATIHGLCPVVAPGLLGAEFAADKTAAYRRTVDRSGYFAPVSETTRGEFLEHFPVSPSRVRAIPLGVSSEFRPRCDEETMPLLASMGIDLPYLLYVGGIQPNKNIPQVLRTFARLKREGVFEGSLVLAGDQHYSEEEFESLLDIEGLLDAIDTAPDVILPGFFSPDDPRLAALYSSAKLFLFPSLYEGWTSPPLEAMASGVPVIASSCSSIPETVGDAAVTVDPQDSNAWVMAATELLTIPSRHDALREAGLSHAAQFPWSRTISRTIGFYEDVITGKLDEFDPVSAARAAIDTPQPDSDRSH
ncbi:MAG: glycosyltransferase family 1 protein [Planctomycetota bacterium]